MRTSPVKGGEKTLTKQEFDALFERCKARCLPSDQGQIQEKLARFTNENGQVSAQALAVFSPMWRPSSIPTSCSTPFFRRP